MLPGGRQQGYYTQEFGQPLGLRTILSILTILKDLCTTLTLF